MTVDETLEKLFPNHRTECFEDEWAITKNEFAIGREVEGIVVSTQRFGVFLRGTNSFPLLLLITLHDKN